MSLDDASGSTGAATAAAGCARMTSPSSFGILAFAAPANTAATAANTAVVSSIRAFVMSYIPRLLLDRATRVASVGGGLSAVVAVYDTALVTLATHVLGGGVGLYPGGRDHHSTPADHWSTLPRGLRRSHRGRLLDLSGALGVGVLATVLGLVALDRRPLWMGEAMDAQWAGIPWNQYLDRIRISEMGQTLYPLMLKPWVAAASDAEWALRLPSVAFVALAELEYETIRDRKASEEHVLDSYISAIRPSLAGGPVDSPRRCCGHTAGTTKRPQAHSTAPHRLPRSTRDSACPNAIRMFKPIVALRRIVPHVGRLEVDSRLRFAVLQAFSAAPLARLHRAATRRRRASPRANFTPHQEL
jgi:hypothetical protein